MHLHNDLIDLDIDRADGYISVDVSIHPALLAAVLCLMLFTLASLSIYFR